MKKMTIIIDFLKKINNIQYIKWQILNIKRLKLSKNINLDKIHNKIRKNIARKIKINIRKILINIKELMLGCLGQLKEFPQAPFLF